MADSELLACTPTPIARDNLNLKAKLPYGCSRDHIRRAMQDWIDFLGFVNGQLQNRVTARLETLLMPANFSSMVGEFMVSSIPKYCSTLLKNRYHNGHPDLIPCGRFPGDAVQHTHDGIEVKGSRYLKGWQGHNPEEFFLLVFVFDSNRPADKHKNIMPKPFRFVMVGGARLAREDWVFSGRSRKSRRTITASVAPSGYQKIIANCVYNAAGL